MPEVAALRSHDGAVVVRRAAPRSSSTITASSWWLDLAVIALALAPPTLSLLFGPERGDTPADGGLIALGLAIAVPLILLRKRSPLGALAGAGASAVILIVVTGQLTPVLGAVVVLLYTVATQHARRTVVMATVATMVPLFLAVTFFEEQAAFGPQGLAVVAWTSLAAAAGDAVRNRRAYLAALEDRARRAEEQREEDARRRVIEERLRIARDLHDVVAHRMAVINVQAGVAEHLVHANPDQAEAALREVRTSASSVLTELGEMLHVLRRSESAHIERAPTDPAPRLAAVDELLGSFRASGLVVTHEIVGEPASASDAAQLTAYRVVQEGLTNAQRHGAGTATLRLTVSELSIDIVMENPIASSGPQSGSGLGLVGMRERIAAAGGLIDTRSRTPGVFRIAVTIPAQSTTRT
jgi:signal transduction histidine kinase